MKLGLKIGVVAAVLVVAVEVFLLGLGAPTLEWTCFFDVAGGLFLIGDCGIVYFFLRKDREGER